MFWIILQKQLNKEKNASKRPILYGKIFASNILKKNKLESLKIWHHY